MRWGKGYVSAGLTGDLGCYRAVKALPVLNHVKRRRKELADCQAGTTVPLPFPALPGIFQCFPLHSPFFTRCQIVSSGVISLAVEFKDSIIKFSLQLESVSC